MHNTIRNTLLVTILLTVTWLGWRFVNTTTDALEGTQEVLEVDMLSERATDKARAKAAECDVGDGNACGALWSWHELGKEGLQKDIRTHRRLCRKACEGGDQSACKEWEEGNKNCPMGST